MTTTAEKQPAKPKQTPDFYIFENGASGEKSGKPVGAAFGHGKGNGVTLLLRELRHFNPTGGIRCE